MRKLILMTSLALTMLLIANGATQTIGGYTWTYRIVDGGAEVCDYNRYWCAVSPTPTGRLSIASILGGNFVTRIGDFAFNDCAKLTLVIIPSSVVSIGYAAFSGCSGLEDVWMSSRLTSIGDYAFSSCRGLTSVVIPSSVTSIGNYAFCGCSGLTSVTIPEGVTNIGDSAFYCCSGLTSVTIPHSVTVIGYAAFYGCNDISNATVPGWKCGIDFTSVTNLAISEGTTSIGNLAFSGCGGLRSVTIPSSVTSIGNYAFSGCGLRSVTIPLSVTNVGSSAFSGCYIRNVTVPGWKCGIDFTSVTNLAVLEGTTSIGNYAFSGCSGLRSVTIPSSVTRVADSAFNGCSEMTAFSVDAQNANYQSVDGLLLTKDGNRLVSGVNGEVWIPSSVTSIGDTAFYGCSGLKSVTMPSSVKSIGNSAFSGCSGLTAVMIPEGVISIGSTAFEGCSGLKSVTIQSSVTRIGNGAFFNCSRLTAADFEGAPPEGLANACFSKGITLRYNAAYEDEWLPAIAACGFTNATAYTPTSKPTDETVPNVSASEISSWVSQTLAPQFAALAGESQAAYCSRFTSAFGTDYAAAFRSETGKIGAGNTHFQVWHDYVAGTDPLETNSVFKAYIDSSNGMIQVKWSPDLNEEGTKSLRNYKIWGKESLDEESPWQYPTNALHRFFKVTVEMP